MRAIALVLGVSICAGALASEALFQAIDDHRERAALDLLAGGNTMLEARNAKGDTPLHRAVETGLRQLTKALLEAGADPGARTRNGETALHLAALHPEPEFADLLLAAGAQPGARNADGDSPLHWAALSGHIVVVQSLLARGSASDYARRDGHDEVMRLLDRVSK